MMAVDPTIATHTAGCPDVRAGIMNPNSTTPDTTSPSNPKKPLRPATTSTATTNKTVKIARTGIRSTVINDHPPGTPSVAPTSATWTPSPGCRPLHAVTPTSSTSTSSPARRSSSTSATRQACWTPASGPVAGAPGTAGHGSMLVICPRTGTIPSAVNTEPSGRTRSVGHNQTKPAMVIAATTANSTSVASRAVRETRTSASTPSCPWW